MWLFYYFNFERSYDVLRSKSPCILLKKNINFNKNETESKMENIYTDLERQALCLSSYKNRKFKVKLKNSRKMWTRITPNTDTFYAVYG